jgi:hypothetical protein
VNDDSDELLGARLDAALRADLDTDRVDVATLLAGSHRRARRLHTQRVAAMTAAAVLVVAVPVSYKVIDPHPTGITPPAAMLPSGSGSAVPRKEVPSAHPDPSPAATPAPDDVGKQVRGPRLTSPPRTSTPTSAKLRQLKRAMVIPDWFAFTEAELPPGVVLSRAARSVDNAIVEDQNCGRTQASPHSVAGRQWIWQTKGAGSDAQVVSLTVTSWAEADAATVFKVAISEFGSCGWFGRQVTSDQGGAPVNERWSASSTQDGQHYGRAVIRFGNGIVGIQVRDPDGLNEAAKLADDLAVAQDARLQRFAKIQSVPATPIAATSSD